MGQRSERENDMDAMLHIGNERGAPNHVEIAKAITSVLQAGFHTHAEQDTIRTALQVFTTLGEVKNVSITGSSFVSNPAPSPVCVRVDPPAGAENSDDGDRGDDFDDEVRWASYYDD